MEEQSKGFRSAVFGGFKREDVLHYIEEMDRAYFERTDEMQKALTEAQSALEEMRLQSTELTAKNAELLERLGEMTLESDKIRGKLDEIESGFSTQQQEVEAQSARAEVLADEIEKLEKQNAELSEKCGEYAAAKDKIAEMELTAYRRAKSLEADAKTELEKLRQQSLDLIAQVKVQLDTTNQNYRAVLSRSQAESAEMAKRASETLVELDRISQSLDKQRAQQNPSNSIRSGIQDILGHIRPKSGE